MELKKSLIMAGSVLAFMSCQQSGPKDFLLGKDQCDNCKMTTVSYTHLDVYKRQVLDRQPTFYSVGHLMICLLYTSRCV